MLGPDRQDPEAIHHWNQMCKEEAEKRLKTCDVSLLESFIRYLKA
jgi:hypothetical protein